MKNFNIFGVHGKIQFLGGGGGSLDRPINLITTQLIWINQNKKVPRKIPQYKEFLFYIQ